MKVSFERLKVPKLFMESGTNIGKDYPVSPNMVLGRDRTCSVVLEDAWASRKHARIYQEGGFYHIEDLTSGNGTYLNGVKISRSPLTQGDRIRIGETVLVFIADPAPTPDIAKPVSPALPREVPQAATRRREVPAESTRWRKTKKPRSPIRAFFSFLLFLVFLAILFVGSFFATRLILEMTDKEPRPESAEPAPK